MSEKISRLKFDFFYYLNNKITIDAINKQEETREKFDHLAYKRRYYHKYEEFRKDKNRQNREHSALRYRNNPEFRKTNKIELITGLS